MSLWTKVGTIAALSLSMAVAGTGCLANSDASDEMMDEQEVATAVAEDNGVKADDQADEKTGEANQAWWGGFGRFGFPFFGGCFPFGGFGGCGFGGFGGCGFGGFGGCGFGGFGGCGFPFFGGGCW